jgi:hypothetical protein
MLGANSVISTKRLVVTNGKEAYPSENILFDEEACIEQMTAEAAAMWSGENALLMHKMFLDEIQEIKTSDLVTDDLGNEYIVKGVQFFRGGDVPSHTEIAMVKEAPKV